MTALLVFGQGPVIDRVKRVKAADAGTVPGEEDMNFWGHSLALAGAILYHDRVSSEIIVMGGKTGGEAYASEAELIRDRLVDYGVPSSVIKLEQSSTNTLENIVNFMDLYLGDDPERWFDLLGTNYHLARIELLMDLFGVSRGLGFGSHEVIQRKLDGGYTDPRIIAAAEKLAILDIPLVRDPDDSTGFYRLQRGVERKTYYERDYEERAFARMLLEVPEYWMTYLGRIEHDLLLQRVLQNVSMIFSGYLESLGIDPAVSEPEALNRARSILGPIPRPDIARWIREEMPKGWPLETVVKLDEWVWSRRST